MLKRVRSSGLPLLLLGGMGLLALLVLGFAAFATRRIRVEALAAAEMEGRALLWAVAAGVERSLEASVAVEELIAQRLLDAGRQMGRELAERPGWEVRLLDRLVQAHGLRGALFADSHFRVLASSGGPVPLLSTGAESPFAAERIRPLTAERMLDRAREAGLGEEVSVTVGFGSSPFGRGVEFLVGLEIPSADGWLVLWEDARKRGGLREREGVQRLLVEAADSPAIVWLELSSADGQVVASTPRPDREVLEVALPAAFRGERPGILRVGLTREPVEGVVRRGRQVVWAFAMLALALSLAAALALAYLDRARRRREARFARELGERERIADLGRMAAGVAHEVRGPLNAIGMAAQFLVRDASSEEPDLARIREMAVTARQEVGRLSDTVGEFLSLGRPRPYLWEQVRIGELVHQVLEAEHPGATTEGPGEEIVLRADREDLRRAVANLVRNARQLAGAGPVVVAWRRHGGDLELEVRDGGPGIPPAERERIFTHFVSGRPGGTGIGLAVVRNAAHRHGGRVEVADAPEGGACFRLTLPIGRPVD